MSEYEEFPRAQEAGILQTGEEVVARGRELSERGVSGRVVSLALGVSLVFATRADACWGLGGLPGGGSHFTPILRASVVVLVLAQYGYCRLVGLQSNLIKAVVSVGVSLGGFWLLFARSVMNGEEVNPLWKILLPIFLTAYVLLYKRLHEATFKKTLGSCLLGLIFFPATVFCRWLAFEYLTAT